MYMETCSNCDREIYVQNMLVHTATCARHNYKCEDCGTVVHKNMRDKHAEQHQLVECECGKKFQRMDLLDHKLICNSSNPDLIYPDPLDRSSGNCDPDPLDRSSKNCDPVATKIKNRKTKTPKTKKVKCPICSEKFDPDLLSIHMFEHDDQ